MPRLGVHQSSKFSADYCFQQLSPDLSGLFFAQSLPASLCLMSRFPFCRMQLLYSNTFRRATELHTPGQKHTRTCQHQELLMGVVCMDGHNEGHYCWNLAPLPLAVFSVDTKPFMYSLYCFPARLRCMPVPDKRHPSVKCVCLIKSALTRSWHDCHRWGV